MRYFLLLTSLLFSASLYAQTLRYDIGFLIGDGQQGRVYKKWESQIENRSVRSVSITLRKQKGGNDSFVNLRYGSGNTFENGKRVYLRDRETHTVFFNVGGESPNGRPLVLNAYNSEVYVEKAIVEYDGASNSEFDGQPSVSYDAAFDRCRSNYRIGRPRIDIGRTKATGNLFSSKSRVSGSIYAQCVQEAGYFEFGRLKEKIEFPLDDRYVRREFEVSVRANRKGEIRVYTVDGQQDVIPVD
ncbi:MAG: hypothetical protein H6619_04165 [Deltaproteobacteria bacterium]|nr:hypothetical protein [Deltaproteobacteria bacterium]